MMGGQDVDLRNTTLSVKSNVTLKSLFEMNPDHYKPVALMPPEYLDVRNEINWTPLQRSDVIKSLYYAKKFVDIWGDEYRQ